MSGVGWRYGHILGVGTTVDAGQGDERGGAARCGLRTAMPPILSMTAPEGVLSLGERQLQLRIPTWRNHWNWGQRSHASSGGQLRVWRRRT